MPNCNVETKTIFEGEDQVTCVTEKIERETDKFYEYLYKAGKLPHMNLTWWQKLEQRIGGVTREAEKMYKVRPTGQWTGRAAALARLPDLPFHDTLELIFV